MINDSVKKQIIDVLLPYEPVRIGVFGSYARGENSPESDLDLLVHFKNRIGLLRLVQLQQRLSDLLKVQVDLVTENGLKNPRLKKYIYKDLISIFDKKERPVVS